MFTDAIEIYLKNVFREAPFLPLPQFVLIFVRVSSVFDPWLIP